MLITHRVSSHHWRRARDEYRDVLERPAMPWNPERPATLADLWLLGPEAEVTFREAETTAVYVGPLLYLTSGLAMWLRNLPTSFAWIGESVWQTPDLDIRRSGETTAFSLGYRIAQSITASTGDAMEAVAGFVSAVATDVSAHAPEVAVLAIDDWGLASPATE